MAVAAVPNRGSCKGCIFSHTLLLLLLCLCLCLWCYCICSGAEAYVPFGTKRFFKDFATYTQQLAAYKASPSSLGFQPAWFFDEVQPLASFNMQCGDKG